MRRCHYCPSTEFHSCRFHPADFALAVFGVRRRCEFCGRQQFHWWLPRPVRWVLAVMLIACAYVASAAVIGWANATPATETRLRTWIYPPLTSLVKTTKLDDNPVAKRYFGWLVREDVGSFSTDRESQIQHAGQVAANSAIKRVHPGSLISQR